MSEVVIQIEKVSKLYRLGNLDSGSVRRDLKYWFDKKFRNKEDPFFYKQDNDESSNQFIWALKDISFEVRKGEAMGIIGSNGSGKSTLLKIISRIVEPTAGTIRGKGKVSSILEVGTGFNDELSGRENIFISGYTLGMSKAEIIRKFDEMVAFSGIERFLDTPVKRYSSGMYVRLAFAVAAHLEPDILIVDEVLAVGDADFQKKCMGKMQEVSATSGRTILFVSHNMQAISNLCSHAVWLKNGKLVQTGTTKDVVDKYIASIKSASTAQTWSDPDSAPGNDFIRMKSVQVKPCDASNENITVRTSIAVDFEFWCFLDNSNININLKLLTVSGECVFNLGTNSILAEKGIIALRSIIPGNLLNNSTYLVALTIVKNHSVPICEFANCTSIDVEDESEGIHYFDTWQGIIRPQIDSRLYLKEYAD